MSVFVDRNREMELIEESFQTLLDENRLLRNPILEFYGVSGIGKTLLLERIKERCQATDLPYIWIDLAGKKDNIQSKIIAQVKEYLKKDGVQSGQSAVSVTKALLNQGPLVMLFDAIDETSSEQVQEIELLLRDLIEDEKLFVVMAGKTMVDLTERSVTRKLRWYLLEALDRDSCEEYLDKLEQRQDKPEKPIAPDVRKLIFTWTQGYPLAMNVMIEAINAGHDPRTEAGKRLLLEILQERVIDQEILKEAVGEWKDVCFTALRLFSVPRRSNTVIMEDLIRKFAPKLHRESSLAYLSLPKELHETTHIFSWNLERFGFTVETPVRHIFLLLYSQIQPQEYFAVHNFLAQLNQQMANEATGQDRVRYMREYLYHLASNTTMVNQSQRIIEAIGSVLKEPPVILQPFLEEFVQDQELKEALGLHLATVERIIEAQKKDL